MNGCIDLYVFRLHRQLDLTHDVENVKDGDVYIYNLYAVIHHIGTTNTAGHCINTYLVFTYDIRI
jgi:hypothetical protein